jgi:O-antigen ligase
MSASENPQIVPVKPKPKPKSKSAAGNYGTPFYISRFLFLAGLAFVTFEEIRPAGGIMLSDFLFGLSILFLPRARWSSLSKSVKYGFMVAPGLILLGAILSLQTPGRFVDGADALLRLFVLFAVIALLALCHSANIYKNLLAIVLGISVNCFITILQAWIYPGIVDALSVNPPQADVGFSGRFQGMTEFPVTLGLAAALGVLIAMGLFSMERNRHIRLLLGLAILVCSAAALLSGSRTFFASLIPSVIVFALFQKQHRKGILYASAGLVFALAAIAYVAPKLVSQYTDRVSSVGFIDYGRLALIAQIALEISEKPILGWGVDHIEEGGVLLIPDTGEVAPAHNTFLRYWYASGILGGIGFLALFVLPVRRIIRSLKEKPSDKHVEVVRLILACYVFYFVVCNLGPYMYNRYIFVPLFVFSGFVVQWGLLKAPKTALQPAIRLHTSNIHATS